jgi:hypothetical protein
MPTAAITSYTGAKLEPAWAPDLARTQAFKIGAGAHVKGEILGFLTASGAVDTYATGNSDGTQTAAVIAQYDMYSDGTNVSLTTASALLPGENATEAPCYIQGYFKCSELTGLDSGAITDMAARLIGANTVSGVLALF